MTRGVVPRATHTVRLKSDRRPRLTCNSGYTQARWGDRDTFYDVRKKRADGPKGQIAAIERKIAEIKRKLDTGRIARDVGIALLIRYSDRRTYLLSK